MKLGEFTLKLKMRAQKMSRLEDTIRSQTKMIELIQKRQEINRQKNMAKAKAESKMKIEINAWAEARTKAYEEAKAKE